MAMWQHRFGVYVWCSVWRCKLGPAYISTQNVIPTHQTYAATLPYWTFYIFSNFKLSDFNEETTSSLRMI